MSPLAPRTCPGCEAPMQAFFVDDVELDRCPRCRGLWFDWGELQQVTGRSLTPELLAGDTERRCASCLIPLLPAILPGGVPVETCAECGGLYLDAGELDELGGRELESPPPAPARPARTANTFACVKCGQRLPLRQGNAVASGLACPECTPQPQPPPKSGEQASLLDRFVDHLSSGDAGWVLSVLELLD